MNPEIKQKLLERVRINPYVNYLGIELLTVEDGLIEARMPLRDEQKQYSGVSHGGVLAALADTIAGYAAYTLTPPEKDVLTAELKVSFFTCRLGKSING